MFQRISKTIVKLGRTAIKESSYVKRNARSQHLRSISQTHSSIVLKVESLNRIEKGIQIVFNNSEEHKFNNIWLRDHCRCSKCYFEGTYQRNIDTHTIPLNIQPKDIECDNDSLKITWPDDHVSIFNVDWLYDNHYGQPYHAFAFQPEKREYWGAEKQDNMVAAVEFENVMSDDKALYKLLNNIAVFGHGFVSNTPLEIDEGLKKIGKRIGPLKESIYGDSWALTNKSLEEVEFLDTSYLNVGLPGHTDGTYSINTPGLQFFHVPHHDGEGGDSLLVDAIGCAKQLREKHPDAFTFLSKKFIPGIYYQSDYYWSRDFGPMISVDSISKEIYKIRFNDLDRDILSCLPYDDVQQFYESLHSFTSIMTDKRNELWYRLHPGCVLIVDNWRVLHGRSEFTGSRTLQGTYINRDEYMSKIRLLHEKFGDI